MWSNEALTQAETQTDGPRDLPPQREPIFNIPNVLIAYVAILAIIEAVRAYLLTPDLDQSFVSIAAFIPARYLHSVSDQSALGYFLGPVGYSFLHGGWAHLGSNALFLVIFATPLTERIGALRFTLLWITSAIASAFFLAVLTGFEVTILVGASGVVSAMAGASCRFVMPLLGSRRITAARYAPRLGLIEALGKRSVIVFVAIWLLFNVVMAGVDPSSNVAWQAHLGGFLFGYLTFGLFDPPLRH
jgi:membrane associated rhomboid family serine protease